MLEPRFNWTCYEPGCCVFSGGTAEYDIYMGKCHERPWNPNVLLVGDDDDYYEFTNQKEFAERLKEEEFWGPETRETLGHALAFVQCFFPTPERWALNEMRKDDAAI